MLGRPVYSAEIRELFGIFPVVAILGPRQCGKTTLARTFDVPAINYLDLENPADLRRMEDPMLHLADLRGLVVIDEVQRRPAIFQILRVLADREATPARFLLLGSASPDIIRGVSESLAGRIGFVRMGGFDITEVGVNQMKTLWERGGFPRSFLATTDLDSFRWRESFIETFLARDLPLLGISYPMESFRRFWEMLAHYHGQTLNASEIGASLGMDYRTVQRHIDTLVGTFMVRVLPPWFENLGKRLRKAPKLYLRDSGLFHSLMGIRTPEELVRNPKLGASWEGFAVEQVLTQLKLGPGEAYYFAAHGGAEIDLVFLRGGRRYGVEVKYSSAPEVSVSLRHVIRDLRLERAFIVCPCEKPYPAAEKVDVVPLANVADLASL